MSGSGAANAGGTMSSGVDAPSEVYREAHGVPGTAGRPAAGIARVLEPGLFDDAMWLPGTGYDVDRHVGFRATFTTAEPGEHLLRSQASSLYRIWIDDEIIVSGPLRYVPAMPEYTASTVWLPAGRHTVAVHAVAEGLANRTTAPVPGFAWVRLDGPAGRVPLAWRARHLDHFRATGVRTSPLLGWLEWQGTPVGSGWRTEDIDPAIWYEPKRATDALAVLGAPTRSDVDLAGWPPYAPSTVSSGRYRETYPGYEYDDPAVQFMLADDDPDDDDDHDGIWVRYDLGRVRLGSMELTVRTEEPATVQIAYAERLGPDGRPAPVVALSTGATCMIQHYAIGPGISEIVPLQSLGGRWVEVRIATGAEASIVSASFRERDQLGEPGGTFASGPPVLDRIWAVGVDTLRACAEDSLVDSVRERGEWVGDVVSSALHIMHAGWGTSALVRRALLHAAAGARADGLVAGCGPGELIYLGTYAAQWMPACVEVATVERSLDVLRELEGAARENMRALVGAVRDDGTHTLPWSFVDWGYQGRDGQPDAAVFAHLIVAVTAWIRWQELLGSGTDRESWLAERERLAGLLLAALPDTPSAYHAYTLAAHAGVIPGAAAVPYIFDRLETGFPLNPAASRLRDPTRADDTSVTPYFTNYSFPILLNEGHGVRVRDFWERGWGWMLDRGATTWWEVFDDRWSRCHYWSGSPTWQLTRFGLGLHPQLSPAGSSTRLRLNTLGLDRAGGRVPLGNGEYADVEWELAGAGHVNYRLGIPSPQEIERAGRRIRLEEGRHLLMLRPTGRGDVYE